MVPGVSARSGGLAVQVIGAARALQAEGVETAIYTTDLAGSPQAPLAGRRGELVLPPGADEVDLRVFPARWPTRWAFSPALQRALHRDIDRYDVVHIHSLFLHPQLAAYLASTRSRTPYVVALHGALSRHLRRGNRFLKSATDVTWQRRMLDRAAYIDYKTPEEMEEASDLRLAAPGAVVPCGIDWNEYQALPPGDDFRARYDIEPDAPLVLSVSRISRRKGFDVLIDAFSRVAREVPGALLVIGGPDDEALLPELRAQAAALGVANRVRFVGMLKGRDRLAALAAADVWALSSQGENFGLVVIEAMAAGLATVVSPGVAIGHEVADTGASVVVEPGPDAFAREIVALLRDPVGARVMGAKARELAQFWDWSYVVHSLIALYSDAIASSAPAPEPHLTAA